LVEAKREEREGEGIASIDNVSQDQDIRSACLQNPNAALVSISKYGKSAQHALWRYTKIPII
jgi:hypothetical protein